MKHNGSVLRIFAILELISKHQEGLTLGQIYRMLDMPKATAYDILKTLYHIDAIYYKDPILKNYVIGSKIYGIGSVYGKNSSLLEVSNKYLKNFSDETGYTTHVIKRIEDKIIYVYKYEPDNRKILTDNDVGTMFYDLEKDISGRCFLIFDHLLDPTEKQKCLSNEECNLALSRGYITDVSGSTSHIRNVAVPIYNFENRVVGVLVASDLEMGGDYESILPELKIQAANISKGLGFIGDYNE